MEINMKKIFIDGGAGTTGLRIVERLSNRDDLVVKVLPDDERKNIERRRECINKSDVTFLCLPDDAAREAVSLVENENTVIIDASTAHRTLPEWAYAFPELSEAHYNKIKRRSVSPFRDATRVASSHLSIRSSRRARSRPRRSSSACR